jgi:hypothetical protein
MKTLIAGIALGFAPLATPSVQAASSTHFMEYRGTLDSSQSIGPMSAADARVPYGSPELSPGECVVTVNVQTSASGNEMIFVGSACASSVWVRPATSGDFPADHLKGWNGNDTAVTLVSDPATHRTTAMTCTVDQLQSWGNATGKLAKRRSCLNLRLINDVRH